MLRDAKIDDCDFICNLILAEAKSGHFSKELLDPIQSQYLRQDTANIIKMQRRSNGEIARALIWEKEGIAIGFLILSSVAQGKGTELWMAAISKDYRSKGEGTKLIDDVLSRFPSTQSICARCFPASQTMFNILQNRQFKHIETDKNGNRLLFKNLY